MQRDVYCTETIFCKDINCILWRLWLHLILKCATLSAKMVTREVIIKLIITHVLFVDNGKLEGDLPSKNTFYLCDF